MYPATKTKKILSTFLILIVLSFSNCGKSDSKAIPASDTTNSESLVQEKDSPLLFLDITAKIRQKENSNQKNSRVIYGTINNTAIQAKFKDAVLSLNYYSAANDLIESAEIIIYKVLEPNTRTEFELNVNTPDSMQTFEVQIKDAKSAG